MECHLSSKHLLANQFSSASSQFVPFSNLLFYVYVSLAGHQLQQKYLYVTNHRHNRIASVSRDAAAIDNEGTCIHFGIFGVFEAKSWRIACHMGAYQGAQRTGDHTDTGYVSRQQMRWEHFAWSVRIGWQSWGARMGRFVHGNIGKKQHQCDGAVSGKLQTLLPMVEWFL